jgi:ribonuclease HII
MDATYQSFASPTSGFKQRCSLNTDNGSEMRKANSPNIPVVLKGGLDEVGRGCLAGPLCIAVVAFPSNYHPIPGVADSKKVPKHTREKLAPLIVKEASFFGIGWATPKFIDDYGMNAAWQYAAMEALRHAPEMELVVDGVDTVIGYTGRQKAVVKADDLHWVVSAASIVAKVLRDNEMVEMAEHHPIYGWEKNSGYGSAGHRKQILLGGPCYQHRMTFLKKLIAKHKPNWSKKLHPLNEG